MNNDPHLSAIIESKLAQAKTSQQHHDGERARDLLAQVRIYAASLGSSDRCAPTDRAA